MIKQVLYLFEQQAFGVCDWWAERLALPTHKLRIWFIYISFITFGSPLVIYAFMALIREFREAFRQKRRRTVWDI